MVGAARAEGFGVWRQVGATWTLYAPDGTTPVHAFTLNDAAAPTERV